MDPNLKRNAAVLRTGNTHYGPKEDGRKREFLRQSPSITQAKRYSRDLMKQGKIIVTKES